MRVFLRSDSGFFPNFIQENTNHGEENDCSRGDSLFFDPACDGGNTYAGGAGGEPIFSDAVGWGIVDALVVIGAYFVYRVTSEKTKSKDRQQGKAGRDDKFSAETAQVISPCEEIFTVKW